MVNNLWIAPPSVGNGRAAGSSTTPCDKSDIKIIDVEWLESYPLVCQKDNRITDWQVWKSSASTTTTQVDPTNFFYQDCSDKPAVYFISHSPAQHHKKIKIKVVLEKICGTRLPSTASNEKVKLVISFGNKEFISNDFYLPANEAKETVIIEGDVDHISWLKSPTFSLDYRDYGATFTINIITSETIPLEAFVLYDEPADFYTNGVWAEALRFLFNNIGIEENNNIEESAESIIHYCHTKHGMIYDTKNGENFFFDTGIIKRPCPAGGKFKLRSYLHKTDFGFIYDSDLNKVNCYDQAGVVQSLCGALGIETEWIFMQPYGFINTTNLVGIGKCNNPFYSTTTNGNKIENVLAIPGKGMQRTQFSNHAFIRLKINNTILDATVGPYIGKKSLLEYGHEAIDTKTNQDYNRLLIRIYDGSPYPDMLFPKMLTQSPLTIEAIEKSCKGEYQYYEHEHNYPCKGVTNVVW